MNDAAPLPEADRVPGAPHPREIQHVIGQDAAVQDFVAAARAHRLHHGWLISGPRGVGKATLAWAIAKWLLSGAASDDLSVPPDAAVLRRIAVLSEPRLHLVRRPADEKTGRLRSEITVDEIRKLQGFFRLSATEGGHRVAIIDAADEMNGAASNALLKLLEEPPTDATLILIAHQPARLLPTIRSRCRELRLHPLPAEAMGQILRDLDVDQDATQLSALASGSAGEALRLSGQDGLAIYRDIITLFSAYPNIDRPKAAALAEKAAARPGTEGDPFDLIVTLLDRFLSRAARTGLLGTPLPEAAKGEGETLVKLSPGPDAARQWATAQAQLSARARAGRAVNLDAAALVMDMLMELVSQPVR